MSLGPRLLIADDNRGIREMLDLVLGHRGFRIVHCSGSWGEVLDYVRTARFGREPEVLVVDLDMPGFDHRSLDHLRACVPGASIVIHTGYDARHVAETVGDLPLHVSVVSKGSVRRLIEHLDQLACPAAPPANAGSVALRQHHPERVAGREMH
jgi:DNA-binding NarL/FixJ family response regulator